MVKGGGTFEVTDPATGLKLADVANLGAAEAEAAIAAANAAWPAWKNKTAKERSIIMRKWFDLLIANTEDLARLMTAENGKPMAESRGEVAYGAGRGAQHVLFVTLLEGIGGGIVEGGKLLARTGELAARGLRVLAANEQQHRQRPEQGQENHGGKKREVVHIRTSIPR